MNRLVLRALFDEFEAIEAVMESFNDTRGSRIFLAGCSSVTSPETEALSLPRSSIWNEEHDGFIDGFRVVAQEDIIIVA